MTDIAKISVTISMSGTICPRNVLVKFRHYYVMNAHRCLSQYILRLVRYPERTGKKLLLKSKKSCLL